MTGCKGRGKQNTTMMIIGILICSSTVKSSLPVVQSTLGPIRGIRTGSTEAFLGIPYARAPIGDRRFLPAEPVEPWHGQTLEAKTWSKACIQSLYSNYPDLYSEDCLFINIFRPTGVKRGDNLSTMFFIHGGSFTGGSGGSPLFNGSLPVFNGSSLAADGNVIVCTINYRVGPLGFFVSEELPGVSGGANGGLNGILDQITALRFVQSQIFAFGGDPDSITVFGESAGALSVGVLSVSPVVKQGDLIRRAIIESGSPLGKFWRLGNASEGYLTSQKLMSSLGVQTLAEMRKLPAASLSTWDPAIQHNRHAWIDGHVIPENTTVRQLYKRGQINVDELIIGANTKDGLSVFFPSLLPVHADNDTVAYERALRTYWGGNWFQFPEATIAQIAQAYPLGAFNGDAISAFAQTDGDFNVVCPSLLVNKCTKLNLVRDKNFLQRHPTHSHHTFGFESHTIPHSLTQPARSSGT